MSSCLSQIEGCDKSNFTICETTLPQNYHSQLNNIPSGANRNSFHAAFKKNLLWPDNSTIKIAFLPSDVLKLCYCLPEDQTKFQKSNPGVSLVPILNRENSDPLALEYSRKWLQANGQEKLNVQKQAVKAVLNRYKGLMTLKFDFVEDSRNADIRILFKADNASWAFIGTANKSAKGEHGEQVHFGWFDIATIIHELGHALGMIHEHQNPIGGVTIDWDKRKVYKYFRCSQGWSDEMINNNILNPEDETTLNGSCFDPLSIMLYEYPACLTKNGVGTRFNQRLSAFDTYWLHKNYGGSTVHSLPSGVYRSITETPENWYNSIYGKGKYEASIKLSIELRNQFSGDKKGSDCDDPNY